MLRTMMYRPLIWLLITFLPSATAWGDTLTIGSQTGAQIFFNDTLTRTYNFGLTAAGAGLVFDSIDVNVKGGNAASNTQPVVIQVFGGLGGTGSLLATGTIAASALTTQFAFSTVPLSETLTLLSGGYSVRMTTANTGNYYLKNGTLKLTGTSGSTLSSSLWIEDSNSDGTATSSLTTTQTVLAQPQANTSTVNFGAFRINSSGTTASAVLANTAIATSGTAPGTTQTQFLSSTGAVSGAASLSGFTFSGSSNALAPQASGTFTVGLSSTATQTSGIKTGTVTLTNQSIPGSSSTTGTTNLAASTISVTGTAWQPAIASASNVSLGWFHVGTTAEMATLTGTTQLENTASATGFSEGLLVTGTSVSGNAIANSVPGGLIAAGGSAQVVAGLSAITTVGVNSGTVTLNMVSSGEGTSGLANLTLANQTVIITGTGYSGESIWNTNGGGQWGTLTTNFGTNWQQYNGSPGLDSGFSDTDTATFGTAVTSGTATVTITSATASVRALTFSNGAASYALTGSSGGALVIRGGTTNATVDVTEGRHAIAAPLTFASNVAMYVATGSRLLLSGGASGTNGFIKTGGGILEIVNTNGYTGTTVANGGILKVNGTLSSSDVEIGSTATLMGSGTIGGNTLVAGTHSPGNSPGLQSFEGDLTYEPNATVVWELIGNTLANRGTSFDGIDVGGKLTFGDPTNLVLAFNLPESTVNWGNSFWGTSREGTNGWLVYSVAGSTADQLIGFGNLVLNVQNWADATGNLLQNVRPGASFATYQDGNDVYLTYVAAVPEPATLGSLAAAGFCLLGFAALRRRRRG
jgi:fibronectin-binding autotransporter adhesin